MKKTKILLICTLILVLSCMIFASCSKNEVVSSIALKNDGVIEMPIGKLEYEAHTLLVNYNSGSVMEIPLSEDMFSELDILKLYQPGEHIITASYGGQKCEINVSVKRDKFGEIKFPENTVFTYDGSAHTVEVEGELPANATVSYLGGNSFVNAGTYDVTAVITCDGYETERITTKVTIERAKYDMSNVKFEPKVVTYDGKSHFVAISGKLPSGVSEPTYYIDGNKVASVTDAGKYEVSAVFSTRDPNYAPVDDMKTTLEIIPAEYNLDGIDLVFKESNGTSLYLPWRSYDGTSVSFEIDDLYGSLTNNVIASYTVMNEDGEIISHSNTETNIINAGEYTIRVDFTLLDNKNYKAIEPMEFFFEVDKAILDTSKVLFEPVVVEYNGENHSIGVEIPRGLDISKFEISYEYILSGETLLENEKNVTGVSEVGEYTVRAIFTVKDPNYADIEPLETALVIEKNKIFPYQFDFDNSCKSKLINGEDFIFKFNSDDTDGVLLKASLCKRNDGENDTVVEATEIFPDASGVYSIDFDTSSLENGKYMCIVTVSAKNSNYILSDGNSSIDYYFNFEIAD